MLLDGLIVRKTSPATDDDFHTLTATTTIRTTDEFLIYDPVVGDYRKIVWNDVVKLIASPTENNLIKMDANGRAADSGVLTADVSSAVTLKHASTLLGTKTLDETAISDAYVLVYDSASDTIIYENGVVTGGNSHDHISGDGAAIAAGATTFVATAKVLGRKSAGAGVGEECSVTEVLDLIGSTANNILRRGALAWELLPNDGWLPSDETWTYAAADATVKTWTFTVSGDKTAKYYPGVRVKLTQATGGVKYFIVSIQSTYAAPDTTVTVYGGTDYSLVNEAISSPYYSIVKSPTGFPLDPSKWMFTCTTAEATQSNAASGTFYTLGTSDIPAGVWLVACGWIDIESSDASSYTPAFMLDFETTGDVALWQTYAPSIWNGSSTSFYIGWESITGYMYTAAAKTAVRVQIKQTSAVTADSLKTYGGTFYLYCQLL